MARLHRFSILTTLAVAVCFSAVAWATFIPMTGDPVPLAMILEQGLSFGDKIFSQFEFFAFAAGGAITPDPTTVFVQGGEDDLTGDYILRFLMAWNAGSGQTLDAQISFKVEVIEQSAIERKSFALGDRDRRDVTADSAD